MLLRGFFFALIAFSCVISDERELKMCAKNQPFNQPFSFLFTKFANKIWTAANLGAPKDENFLFFPFNVIRLLNVVQFGTLGETLAQINSASGTNYSFWAELHKEHMECFNETHEYYKIFKMEEIGYFGLYLHPDIRPDFMTYNWLNFKVNFYKRKPFKPPEKVLDALNGDVKKMTNKKIDKFFNSIWEDGEQEGFIYGGHHTVLNWKYPFEKNNTVDGEFEIKPDKKVKVKLMTVKAKFPRGDEEYKDKKFSFVEVPFKEERLSMFIIVPKKNTTMKQLILTMKNTLIDALINLEDTYTYEVTLRLPKFKLEKQPGNDIAAYLSHHLVKISHLQNSILSNLYNMSAQPLFMKAINQSFFLEINEKKLESAAVVNYLIRIKKNPDNGSVEEIVQPKPKESENDMHSEVGLHEEVNRQMHKFELNVTKPFIYVIIDRAAKIPMIMGKIVKVPSKKGKPGVKP